MVEIVQSVRTRIMMLYVRFYDMTKLNALILRRCNERIRMQVQQRLSSRLSFSCALPRRGSLQYLRRGPEYLLQKIELNCVKGVSGRTAMK